jgi:hypothetical protein
MNSKERLLLLSLAAVNFTHIMDFMIMMPLGPQLMDIMQITPRQFSLAVSAYGITAGVSSFAAAFFVDRFDRKKILLFAYIGFLLGTFSCAFAPNYELLVAARVLAGLFGGMIGAQVLAIVADTFEYERRATAMGVLMTAFSAASVAGVPAGLWLAARFSWHVPFLAIGLLGIGVLGMVFSGINRYFSNPQSDAGAFALDCTDDGAFCHYTFHSAFAGGKCRLRPGSNFSDLPGGRAAHYFQCAAGRAAGRSPGQIPCFCRIRPVFTAPHLVNYQFMARPALGGTQYRRRVFYRHQWPDDSDTGAGFRGGTPPKARRFHEHQFFCATVGNRSGRHDRRRHRKQKRRRAY